MYLEFSLPHGAAGQAAGHALLCIRKDLVDWAIKYDIVYKEKLVKYTLRVFFQDLETYTFFGLTWVPNFHSSKNYRLVEPMDPPKSN